MTTRMNLRVEEELKRKFMTLANMEGSNATEILTDLMKKYIDEKIKENGLYALLLSKDYIPELEEKEIMSSLKSLTEEDTEVAYEEIIEI